MGNAKIHGDWVLFLAILSYTLLVLMLNPEDRPIRAKIERVLGKKLTEPMWDLLVTDNWIDEIKNGTETYERVVRRVREIEHAVQVPLIRQPKMPKRRQRRLKGVELRTQAIAILLAGEARRRDDVQAFRDSVLSGNLFTLEEATAWIRAEAEIHTPESGLRVVINAPSGMKFTSRKDHYKLKPPLATVPIGCISFINDRLDYLAMDSEYVRSIAVRGPNLEGLRELSQKLARHYGWSDAWATMFILTDQPSPVFLANVGRAINSAAPSLIRITLNVDVSLSPREVCQIYANERISLLGKRPRVLKDKQVRLAMFVSEFKGTPREAMYAWNRRNPVHSYRELGLFNRDAKRARDLLLRTLPVNRDKLSPPEQMGLALGEYSRRVSESKPHRSKSAR